MNEPELATWLTLPQLAEVTGRHIDAVRTWAYRRRKQGRHNWRKNNRAMLMVETTPEVLTELKQATDEVNEATGANVNEATSSPDRALNEADEFKGLRDRVEELLERAARAEAERDTIGAAHAAEAALLRAALAKAEARADRLEAALAEARRPWLAKVIEGLRRRS
jgi:hypothetical protein